jgi:hypothetical protein
MRNLYEKYKGGVILFFGIALLLGSMMGTFFYNRKYSQPKMVEAKQVVNFTIYNNKKADIRFTTINNGKDTIWIHNFK